jgi:hypothetical protein
MTVGVAPEMEMDIRKLDWRNEKITKWNYIKRSIFFNFCNDLGAIKKV